MTEPRQITDEPSAPVRDVAIALLGCMPLGSMLQLLAGSIWKDPAYQNLRKFAVALAEDVQRLQQSILLDLDEVMAREETRPLLTRAFEAAARSLGEKKLQALRNASVQGIFEAAYPFDLSVMVFTLLDRITEGHLAILQEIRNADAPGRLALTDAQVYLIGHSQRKIAPSEGNGSEVRDTKQRMDLNHLILADLKNMGLVDARPDAPSGIVAMTGNGPTGIEYRNILSAKGKLVYEHLFPQQ